MIEIALLKIVQQPHYYNLYYFQKEDYVLES